MEDKCIYITINHLDLFDDVCFLRPGDRLLLKKEQNNIYDDEAIAAYRDKLKCGYVANSVHSVVRGTCSAGRIYDWIGDETGCIVKFVFQKEESVIALLNSDKE